jgi:hypothetical protein
LFDITPIQEAPPIYGMNTLLDAQDLPMGQCIELVNARPGNPPVVLQGSDVWLLPDSLNYRLVPPALSILDVYEKPRIYVWALDDNTYKLLEINAETLPMSVREIGYANGLTAPRFGLLSIGDKIYATASETMLWNGILERSAGKIINPGVIGSDREHCFSFAPIISDVYATAGGTWDPVTNANFINYAVTLVLRDDPASFDASGNAIKTNIYLPGASESFEDFSGRQTIEIEDSDQRLLISTSLPQGMYQKAVREKATHLRLYKSTRQSTAQNAVDATHYWLMDVPLGVVAMSINGISLSKNPVGITTVQNHGLSNSDSVLLWAIEGSTQLNGETGTVGDAAAKTFSLTGQSPVGISKYVSGGVILTDSVGISSMNIPDNYTTFATTGTSEVNVGDSIIVAGVVGTIEVNNKILSVSEVTSSSVKVRSPSSDMTAYVSGGDLHILDPSWRIPSYFEISDNVKLKYAYGRNPSSDGWLGKYVIFKDLTGVLSTLNLIPYEILSVESVVSQVYYPPGVYNPNDLGSRDGSSGYGAIKYYSLILELDLPTAGMSQDLKNAIGAVDTSTMTYTPRGIKYFRITKNTAPLVITDIDYDSTRVVVTTSSAHGFSLNDSVHLREIVSGYALNDQIFTAVPETDPAQFALVGVDVSLLDPAASGGYAALFRADISDINLSYPRVHVEAHGRETGDPVIINDVVGSTELNGNLYVIDKVDANYFDLRDVDSNGISNYVTGGYIEDGNSIVEDDVPDTTLVITPSVEMVAQKYGPAPSAKFSAFVKDRMWLFGVPGMYGTAFYSEAPGADGGTPLDLALSFPDKYRSWWSAEYAIKCNSDGGGVESGLGVIGNDLYMFFEERIFALFSGDPTIGKAEIISPSIGCPFSNTICKANIPTYGGPCLLFISNKGPAVLQSGGTVSLVNEFAIAELWPNDLGIIFKEYYQSVANREFLCNNCTSMFWRDTWTVVYQTVGGQNKIFECYFDPKMKSDSNAPRGAYIVELAIV